MGEALQSALAGGAPESGARALVNPNLPLCLEKFHTRDGRVAAQDIVDVCREGGFSIQTEDSGQLVVLTNVL